MAKQASNIQSNAFRPPIIAVLGHVDHGKTTLLDYIRKTHVAEKEHGGITQHIGAYTIFFQDKKTAKKKQLTFIDTPGHEAFMNMRSRGAKVGDIALLVVAADDGVKPQTKESIRIIKEAQIPFIVVVNKTDLPSANPQKIREELARNEVQVEGFGGSVPIIAVSAKTGHGVNDLLELIVSCYNNTSPVPLKTEDILEAVVIETRVDHGKGMIATVVVKEGVLKRGEKLFEEDHEIAKVRALFDEHGNQIPEALPGMPAEVLGFSRLPHVGMVLSSESKDSIKKEIKKDEEQKNASLPDFLSSTEEKKQLSLVLKTDTAGSLEAIMEALGDQIVIVDGSVGDITEADVFLAKSTGACLIGFCVKCKSTIEKIIQTEGIVFRNYSIIYELLDELAEVVKGMEELSVERKLGTAHILAEFPFNGLRVAGIKVESGRIARGDMVKIMRGKEEIGKAKIKSVRKGKEDITKIEQGSEGGVLLDKNIDFSLSDDIIAFVRN